ncbi:predicted protein [Thalassiosira pseudonana CCMP1335]|uniref:DUF7640 domain-containing protein n=1 Tax=Thalassiosira pseudonana TaxID=35128 RepID=B8CGJ2_THAPS|nr:predicted protein [Thalassiosira pseudonana CCMP1335]EED87376.1 predicted protein [Thalassiosira pseudonana CCMP1335]
MVSESIITPKKKRVSGGKKSSSDRKERRKLNKKPRKVRQWKPNQVEEEEFNSSTALGLLESTKTRTLQVTVENCSIDNCTCTMIDQTPGKKCDGFEACNGANPDNVACGSCNGFGACTNAVVPLVHVIGASIGENSCNDEWACTGSVGTFIGQNSCNGKVACRELKGSEIGPNSCLGQNACGDSSGATIGSGSCTGVHACADAIGATIGDKSCIEGAAACVSGSGAVIGDDSCVGEQSCQGSSGLIVGNSSCQGLKACFEAYGTVHEHSCNGGSTACEGGEGNILEDSCNAEKSCYKIEAMISTGSWACLGVNGYNIGGCSCNTANECKCSLVNESYECDDSSAVFTNAQDEICQWFPDWAGENKGCVKNVGSNNAPSYMWYNPSMWMFDNLEDCCDTNYPWDLATCLGASAAAGSDKWFVDYSLNKCVKECVGDEPCGGLVDGSWVDLFESQSECCSKKVWWNTKCDA